MMSDIKDCDSLEIQMKNFQTGLTDVGTGRVKMEAPTVIPEEVRTIIGAKDSINLINPDFGMYMITWPEDFFKNVFNARTFSYQLFCLCVKKVEELNTGVNIYKEVCRILSYNRVFEYLTSDAIKVYANCNSKDSCASDIYKTILESMFGLATRTSEKNLYMDVANALLSFKSDKLDSAESKSIGGENTSQEYRYLLYCYAGEDWELSKTGNDSYKLKKQSDDTEIEFSNRIFVACKLVLEVARMLVTARILLKSEEKYEG